MRFAVIGGTGLAGSAVVQLLRGRGYDVTSVSRSSGVDLLTGTGLEATLTGVDTVIDVSDSDASDGEAMINFFTRSAANVLAAERRGSVAHHVLLSIIGADRTHAYPHFLGKMAQEETSTRGGIPYTIVRATQFYEFAESAVLWGLKDDFSDVPPLLMQPVAVTDVAELLVEVAIGDPANDTVEIAGPERHDLVDLARRLETPVGAPPLRLVPSWTESGFGAEMAGDLLLPHPGARIGSTTFEQWLSDTTGP